MTEELAQTAEPSASAQAPALPADVSAYTPEQAEAEIARLRNDPEYTKNLIGSGSISLAGREAAAHWRALQEKAYSRGDSQPANDAAGEPTQRRTYGSLESKFAEILEPPASPDDYKITRDASIPDWDF